MRIAVVALLSLFASVAPAEPSRIAVYPYQLAASTNDYNLLEGVALNATAATRTVTISALNQANLRVAVFYTYSAATEVTATHTCSLDGTNYFTREGTDPKTRKTLAASANWSWDFDTLGCKSFKIVFSGTSAGAGDLVNVQAVGLSDGMATVSESSKTSYTQACTPIVGAPTKLTCPTGADADSGALTANKLFRYDADCDVWADWGTAAVTATANDTKLRAAVPEYFATTGGIVHFSCLGVSAQCDVRLTECR